MDRKHLSSEGCRGCCVLVGSRHGLEQEAKGAFSGDRGWRKSCLQRSRGLETGRDWEMIELGSFLELPVGEG